MDEAKPEYVREMPSDGAPSPTAMPALEEPPASDAWAKVTDLAAKQLDRFMSFEPKVLRGDDPDAIHDMRVASRRLQQILDLLYPKPRPREVQRLRRRIRRCRGALGQVRNCDVLLQMVEKTLGRKRCARREAWTAVRQYLFERRAESFQKGRRKLSKANLAVFYVQTKDLLAPPGSPHHHWRDGSRKAAPGAAEDQDLPGRISESLSGVWNNFLEQIALSQHEVKGPVIHGVRIAAKRVRYLLEVVHEFEVAGSAEALAWLRQLQQHLGEWHDLEVLEQTMVEMLARPQFLREQLELSMQIEKLILRGRETKKRFVEKYERMTRDSMGWQRLKDWVSYLLESPSAVFARD
jgi:CHAD domain-containing protein